MRITFVLPVPIRIPMGGPKVVYAHAEGLARLGHQVTVVAPRLLEGGFSGFAKSLAINVRDRLHRVQATEYYQSKNVRSLVVPTISDAHVPGADVVIATGVQTSPWVRDLSRDKGAKAYFLQHVETFIDSRARETWSYPLSKITIARWIQEEVEQEGETVLGIVPNAIDPNEFSIDNPIEDRSRRLIALYHRQYIKGPDVLIEALEEIKMVVPDLHADIFAARKPPHTLPPFVELHIRPNSERLRQLYNAASILLHPSRSEGSPLVPMEAAACGCAVVASSNQGVQQYLQDNITMHMAPLGDGKALATAAIELLNDDRRRIQLARAAHHEVTRYTWTDSTDKLEALLLQLVK